MLTDQQFHASLKDKSEIEECNAVAPRYEWVEDTYTHKVDGKKVETKVSDPYQWLEDPDSAETKQWVDCQVDMCENFLNSLKVQPEATDEKKAGGENKDDDDIPPKLLRKEIECSLKENLKFGRFSTPYRKKDYYFYRYNEGTWNQSKLYVLTKKEVDAYLNKIRNKKQLELCTDDDHVLIDPNVLSKDGTSQLKYLFHSHDGEKIAYTVSEKGSDWLEIRLKVQCCFGFVLCKDIPNKKKTRRFIVRLFWRFSFVFDA